MELLDRWAEDRGGTHRVAQARLRQSIGKIDPKRDPPAKWSEAGLQRIFHTFAPPLSYPSRRHRVTDRVRSMTRQRRLRIYGTRRGTICEDVPEITSRLGCGAVVPLRMAERCSGKVHLESARENLRSIAESRSLRLDCRYVRQTDKGRCAGHQPAP